MIAPPLRLFDRYVISAFIRYLLFSLLAATVIFVIVDLVEHLDKFIDKDVPLSIVVLYYGYFLPYILYLVLPVAVLLATLFTVSSLSRAHELTAMKASGISLHRILFHLMALGLVLSAANFYFGETTVPFTNKQSKTIYETYVKGVNVAQKARVGGIYLRNRPSEMLSLKRFEPSLQAILDLDWQRFNGEELRERLIARKANWVDSCWMVENAQFWSFKQDQAACRRISSEPFYNLGFAPRDLQKVQNNPEELGYWQLREYVHEIRALGGDPHKWSVELAMKTSMPFTCALVILLGVPIAARYRRSGVALAFGIGLLISFLYFALQQIGRVLGYNGDLPPLFAAWIGNAAFLLIGVFLYWRVRK